MLRLLRRELLLFNHLSGRELPAGGLDRSPHGLFVIDIERDVLLAAGGGHIELLRVDGGQRLRAHRRDRFLGVFTLRGLTSDDEAVIKMAILFRDGEPTLQLQVAFLVKASDLVDPSVANLPFVVEARAAKAEADLVADR